MTDIAKLSFRAHQAAAHVSAAYADTDDHNRRAADHLAASMVSDVADALDEQHAIATAVLRLHTIDYDGEWACRDSECATCQTGGAHQGPICSYCTDYTCDDPDIGGVRLWPCETVRLLEGRTDPGLPPPLHIELWIPGDPASTPEADVAVVYEQAASVPSGIRFRARNTSNRSWLRTASGAYRAWRHETTFPEVSDLWPQVDVDRFAPFILWTEERPR
ncbi:MAG: hypothetical protein WA931_01495 [Rhodococcus sp. (in: high G+C Gram-positive bacteria)]